jgi:hypothetical protein
MNNKPNILVFMTDQQRGDTVLNPHIKTPNLDRLRADGITFANIAVLLELLFSLGCTPLNTVFGITCVCKTLYQNE